MLNLQNKVCYICKKDNKGKTLCVDHDHKTGKVRALLCSSCNKALGLSYEDVNILKAMINYLEKFSGQN